MPNYDYMCSSCGKVEAKFTHIDDTTCVCSCGAMMTRMFSPPISKPILDIEPYWDENIAPQPILVQSRKHKEQLLKENGLKMKRGLSDYR